MNKCVRKSAFSGETHIAAAFEGQCLLYIARIRKIKLVKHC